MCRLYMMGRSPSSEEKSLKKGPWTPEEDQKLVDYIQKHGHGSWRALPRLCGLNRCGKSCRLRWTNYLRPDIKRGRFSQEEEQIIINLHSVLGNKWSAIASRLAGRTDNEIKNYWNTHLKKKLLQMGIDPVTHRPRTDHLNEILANLPLLHTLFNSTGTTAANNLVNVTLNRLHSDHASQLAKIQLLHNILQLLTSNSNNSPPNILPMNLLHQLPHHPDQLISDLLPLMNNSQQLHGNNGCFTTSSTPQDHQILSADLQSFEAPQPPLKLSQSIIDSQFGSSSPYDHAINNPNHQLPALVSASPVVNQMETSNNIKNIIKSNHDVNSDPCSTSTTFEAWGDLIDDEATDSYWKGFLEQASSQPWPNSD
ncbi:hypothetical protein Dsin_001278 [Dipteronia sinensis]|uniref:Uncharacterized protein n=1 Tax=Dipteronia sinensis TaxID=43782 RepID=A0AAE0B3Z5_9ROSI|nr:hypothetical protein Dsin_001278 [Dipteronia sinensis]